MGEIKVPTVCGEDFGGWVEKEASLEEFTSFFGEIHGQRKKTVVKNFKPWRWCAVVNFGVDV